MKSLMLLMNAVLVCALLSIFLQVAQCAVFNYSLLPVELQSQIIHHSEGTIFDRLSRYVIVNNHRLHYIRNCNGTHGLHRAPTAFLFGQLIDDHRRYCSHESSDLSNLLHSKDRFNRTVLMAALRLQKNDIVELILNSFSSLIDITQADSHGYTLLHYATLSGQKQIVEKLLQLNQNALHQSLFNVAFATPLVVAAFWESFSFPFVDLQVAPLDKRMNAIEPIILLRNNDIPVANLLSFGLEHEHWTGHWPLLLTHLTWHSKGQWLDPTLILLNRISLLDFARLSDVRLAPLDLALRLQSIQIVDQMMQQKPLPLMQTFELNEIILFPVIRQNTCWENVLSTAIRTRNWEMIQIVTNNVPEALKPIYAETILSTAAKHLPVEKIYFLLTSFFCSNLCLTRFILFFVFEREMLDCSLEMLHPFLEPIYQLKLPRTLIQEAFLHPRISRKGLHYLSTLVPRHLWLLTEGNDFGLFEWLDVIPNLPSKMTMTWLLDLLTTEEKENVRNSLIDRGRTELLDFLGPHFE